MKKTALYVQAEASKKFNPYTLKDFLIRTAAGTVIVDRSALLKSKDDERMFYVILNKDYRWDYRCPDTTTIYFEVIDGKVYGGTYDDEMGCHSIRLIAESSTEHLVHHYVYSEPNLQMICEAINNA